MATDTSSNPTQVQDTQNNTDAQNVSNQQLMAFLTSLSPQNQQNNNQQFIPQNQQQSNNISTLQQPSQGAMMVNNTQPQDNKSNSKNVKQQSQPSDDPRGYLNSIMLAAVAPVVAQHAVDAYGKTGQIPNADSVLGLHPAMQTGQGQIDPATAMATFQTMMQNNKGNQGNINPQGIGTNKVNNPNIFPPTNAFQNTAYNPQTGQIQEGGWVNRGLRGLSEGGVPGLLGGLLGPSLGSQMGATKQAQVLKAGQPAEIAKPQAEATEANARAAEVYQKITQGGPPPSPADRMAAMGSYNTLNREQLKDLDSSYSGQVDNLQKRYDELKTSMPVSQVTKMQLAGKQLETPEMMDIRHKQELIQEQRFGISQAMAGTKYPNPSKSGIVDSIRSKYPNADPSALAEAQKRKLAL